MTGNAPYKTLPLAKGKVALVDADDHLRLSQFDWQIGRYVFRRYMTGGKQHTVTLQREVMRRPDQRIKFINGNPLDCRKENLQIFAGGEVSKQCAVKCPHCGGELYRSLRTPYLVRVSVDGKRYRVGTWPTKRVAEHIRQIATETAAGLRGRGLSDVRIQRQLDLATGRKVKAA